MSTITSANSSIVITPRLAGALSGLLPALAGVGISVQGYAADDAFATDQVQSAEVRMGVDGRASGGWLPRLSPLTITLQPDSPTLPQFNALIYAQDAIREVIVLDGVVTLPSINQTFAMTKGFMTRITPIPPGKKVLDPVTFEITWESIAGAQVA